MRHQIMYLANRQIDHNKIGSVGAW